MNDTLDQLQEALRPPPNVNTISSEAKNLLVCTVPVGAGQYLPQHLIDKLTRLPPDAFTRYAQEQMTLEERDSLMQHEVHRLKTFLYGWPHATTGTQLTGPKMAEAGFYFVGEADKVMCPFCRVAVSHWTAKDNPLHEHIAACPYYKAVDCGNIRRYQMSNRGVDPLFPEISGSGKITFYQPQLAAELKSTPEFLGIVTKSSVSQAHATVMARLNTFRNWPSSSLPAQPLANAGFFYLNNGDQVKCFFCAGSLRSWNDGDCPWSEHARWFPHCPFLIESKGETFIQEVHRKFSRAAKAKYKSCEQRALLQSQASRMADVCRRLGHSQRQIDLALAHNGGSFSDVKDMIDMLHQIEDGEIQMAKPNEELADEKVCPLGNCKICFQHGRSVLASHVGLPCGHLIFCDACADNSKQPLDNGNIVLCPYLKCNSSLLGNTKASLI